MGGNNNEDNQENDSKSREMEQNAKSSANRHSHRRSGRSSSGGGRSSKSPRRRTSSEDLDEVDNSIKKPRSSRSSSKRHLSSSSRHRSKSRDSADDGSFGAEDVAPKSSRSSVERKDRLKKRAESERAIKAASKRTLSDPRVGVVSQMEDLWEEDVRDARPSMTSLSLADESYKSSSLRNISSRNKPHSKHRDDEGLGRSSHHKRKTKKKTRSLSVDDTPLSTLDEATDAWPLLLSLDKKSAGKGGKNSLDESIQESVTSSRSSRRGRGRRKHRVRSMPVNSSPTGASSSSKGVVKDASEPLMAKTVNEDAEANRKRLRDLEVQNDEMQQHMQGAMLKRKKGKNDGQDNASNGGRKITIRKVIGAVVIYLAGVGTGYLISELRHKSASSAPAKDIYVTQSPTAAILASNDPTTAPTEFSYDDPSPEDCFAIEAKEEVNGQDGMITKSYDVHFDVQLKDSSTDWYGQLQEGVTDKVIPDLACCKGAPTVGQRGLVMEYPPMHIGFSIRGGHTMNRMLRNLRCVVANGSTRGEYNDNGDSCVELTGLCLPAVVTLDLTLKGDEADGDIMDLVRNVIQGDDSEPLVEKFDLEKNVFSLVKLVDVVDHVPTRQPAVSSPPTSRLTLSPTVTLSPAPVVRPTATETPTRAVTQSPTPRGTQPPTIQPAPGVTPIPTSEPTAQPTTTSPTPQPNAEPSPGPTESPSSAPTLVPTILASSSPTASPSAAPSLTPSAAPTGRREVLEAILTPVVGTVDTAALDWLADTDTWIPPATEADPDSAWIERYSMVRFYLATNGASWTDKGGWMTSTPVCDWSPGTCNDNNRIREIVKGNNGLSGTLPTEIGLFSNLDTFKANYCGISGTLPTEIGLPSMQVLRITSNGFSGTIPSELGLSAMTDMDLSNNDLTGSIPSEVLSLSNLKKVVANNNLLTGTIGTELGAMRELAYLELYGNVELSGSFPSEIGLLTKLTFLNMWDCDFIGLIPSELGLLSMLTHIGLHGNDLSGTIPTTLFQLTKTKSLTLGGNSRLNGLVPTGLGLLTELRTLEIYETDMSGTIPSEINLLTALNYLKGYKTDISGSIPDLSALVNLKVIHFAKCGLTGSFPPGMFNNMVALEQIRFAYNNLTGAIPAVPNPSLLTYCAYRGNCFSDLTNAGTCDLAENC